MMHFRILFDRYDWDIEVYIVISTSSIHKVIDKLESLGCSDRILHKAYSKLVNFEDSGFTYSNPSKHKSIMVINKFDSARELVDTYNHEKNHIEMHICEEFGIDPYSEQAAYLSGELAKELFVAFIESLVE